MQMSRSLWGLGLEKSASRKLVEAFYYALQTERYFSKERIFELYMTQIFMGHNVYGFGAAAEYYFGKEAKRRVLLGTYARMAGYRDAYYLKALKARTIIINEFKSAFGRFDVLAAPTMPVIAPKFSEIEQMEPVQQYMMDVLTVAPNLAGIPMISVPCGTSRGMPVGLHLMADHLQEGRLIQAASAFEG